MTEKRVPFRPDDLDGQGESGIDAAGPDGSLLVAIPEALVTFLLGEKQSFKRRADRPTLSLWWDGTYWRGSLHDRLRRAVTFVAALSLAGVLERLREAHEQPDGRWRADA